MCWMCGEKINFAFLDLMAAHKQENARDEREEEVQWDGQRAKSVNKG